MVITISRRSKQKEAILKVLRSEDGHPRAQRIYEQVRLTLPHISLGTVYRDLKTLTADGQISEICDGHESRFDALPGNHYHFHCEGCGSISNLSGEPPGIINDEASHKYRLHITHHRLDYYGICPACDGAAQERTENGRRD